MGLRPALYITEKGALDSQLQVIKFTNCLPMVLSGFSPGTPASSTTKTGCHDWDSWNIAESGVKHNKSIKSDLHQWKVVEIIIIYMSHYLWFLFKSISVSSRNPVRHGMFAIRAPHFISGQPKWKYVGTLYKVSNIINV